MNNFFFKWRFFFILSSLFPLISFFCINDKNSINEVITVNDKNSNNIVQKKKRKIDISILRENLVDQLIELLQLVEKKLNILLGDIKKEIFVQKYTEVMNIFSWINKFIAKFNEDPLACDRSEIESYLNQAQKYKLFLNNI